MKRQSSNDPGWMPGAADLRQHQSILDALAAQVALLDADGVIRCTNGAWVRFAAGNGLRGDAHCIGADYLAVCDQAGASLESARDAAAGIRAVLRGERPSYHGEYDCHSPHEERWYDLRVTPIDIPGGRGAVVMHTDITERKRIERDVRHLSRESERRLQALQDSVREFGTLASAVPQIVWTAAPDGRIVYLNQGWVDATGLPAREGLGGGWTGAIAPEDTGRTIDAIRQARDARSAFTEEIRLRSASGSYRWFLLRGVPVMDAEGRLTKWIGTCTDVDDIKAAEMSVWIANRELERQRSELRTLIDLVPAMVWLKDPSGVVLQLNTRAAASVGMDVDEVVGMNIRDLFPDRWERYSREDEMIRRTGRPIHDKIERLVDADGTEKWYLIDKVPCRDDHGRHIGLLVMKHDITERKRVQRELEDLNSRLEQRVRERTSELAMARDAAERANEAKSSFLAMMSHEIRTPIAGLLGLLELLELTALDDEQRSTLAVAAESGHALRKIVDDVLDFSKIEADLLELDPRPSRLGALVENVAGLHRPNALAKGLDLSVGVDPDLGPLLRFDPTRVGQILNNFLGNAIKFTSEGSVRLRASLVRRTKTHDQLEISVADTGIGIPADTIGRLFQPFVQAPLDAAAQQGGTGLGLFISKRLADLMDGTVALESEPGQGTTLTLRVAFERCPDATPAIDNGRAARDRLSAIVAGRPEAPTVAQAISEGHLILVVDDHPINRMVLVRQVAALGYAAEAAADGREGLQAWESGRFSAIITDCNMPGMSGLELAQAIRSRESAAGRRIPIIGCTANVLRAAHAECLEAGMDAVITKPVALEELCARLDRWLPLQCARAPEQAAPSGAAADGLLDLGLLDAISAGMEGGRQRVLEQFLAGNEADLAAFHEALAQGRGADAGQRAHRIRGVAGMLGASRLAAAAAKATRAATSRSRKRTERAVQELERELRAVRDWVAGQHPPGPAA